MQLEFETGLVSGYHSKSQMMRVMTESWIEKNMYCPICGKTILNHYTANRPVADFYCEDCKNDFELKSKNANSLGKIITDGAYNTMIQRLNDMNNPNFLFMTHDGHHVNNLILIPNHFFTPEIIIKRRPLGENCRRAGWIGCNINIADIPQSGKISIISNGVIVDKMKVIDSYARIKGLATNDLTSRGWLLDVLGCVDRIHESLFTLKQMYDFTEMLQEKHKDNNNVQAKIRQQLQILRDRGVIEFVERGVYRKL